MQLSSPSTTPWRSSMEKDSGRLKRTKEMPAGKPEIRIRTRQYALRIVRLYTALPKTVVAQVIGKQILRSGTSVGAHVAESNRAKSRADFVNKIEGAMQELDETVYWMDLLVESGLVKAAKLAALSAESSELMAIFAAMVKKVRHD
jgi:four helix bundle protein